MSALHDDPPPLAPEPPRRFWFGAHLIAIVLGLISIWMLIGFVGQVITSAQLEQRRAELKAEIALIEATNQALQAQIEYAESPDYAEQQAREQLGYAREGDTVILPTFPEVAPAATAPTPEAVPTPAPHSNWRAWLDALSQPERPPLAPQR